MTVTLSPDQTTLSEEKFPAESSKELVAAVLPGLVLAVMNTQQPLIVSDPVIEKVTPEPMSFEAPDAADHCDEPRV